MQIPDGEDSEVPLQPWIDGERAGSGVECCHILNLFDVFQGVLGAIIPVTVVEVLTKESMRLDRAILVNLRVKGLAYASKNKIGLTSSYNLEIGLTISFREQAKKDSCVVLLSFFYCQKKTNSSKLIYCIFLILTQSRN